MNFKNTLAVLGFAAVASQAVSYLPVDGNATTEAQKLYNFLATNYGVKSISGMMTGDVDVSGTDVKELYDVDSLYDVSGYYPALVGFDFLFATGAGTTNSWYGEYTQATLTYATSLWNYGGIPAFTWHWKDPSDIVDAFYTQSGNAETYTAFDFTEGFVSGTTEWDEDSDVYQQLVSDIDEIAALFLQLQENNVAAIFRPIHEASGGWFWWGVCSGEQFAALYQLIYDRMVTYNGVHNLVWVWNPESSSDTDWDPGTSYYDVISLDIYGATDFSTNFTNAWDTLTTNFTSNDKIFAVSENGPIPDISVMKSYGSVWSWWMPWYQSWDGGFLDQTADTVWKANMADPCVITLDEMPGWSNYTLSESQVDACTVGYTLSDIYTATAPDADIDVDISNCNGWARIKMDTEVGSDAFLIDLFPGDIYPAPSATSGISTVTIKYADFSDGSSNGGVWIGLAIVTDGDASPTWQWEMSNTNSCWFSHGSTGECTFDMTTYTDDDGNTQTMDTDRIYKYTFMVSADGASGSLLLDYMTSNAGMISDFDTTTALPVAGESTQIEGLEGISLYSECGGGTTPLERATAVAQAANLSVVGNNLTLSLAKAANVSVDLYSVAGSRVKTLHKGSLASGSHSYSLEGLSKGLYVVRAKGQGVSLVRTVRVK